jgi:hypothetical protein
MRGELGVEFHSSIGWDIGSQLNQGIENRKHGIMIIALGETGGLSGHSVVLGKRKQIGNPDCEAIA